MTRSKTAVTIGVLAVVAAVFACGGSEESGAAGPPEATPAAGGGVCCPKAPSPCSPGYRGGWAPTAEECVRDDTYDGRFNELVDDHGCAYWQLAYPSGAYCCGCPTVRPDATPDVIASDASDASDGADSD